MQQIPIDVVAPVHAEAMYIEIEETVGAKIDRYALLYKLSSQKVEEMRKTINCESEFNPKAWNKNDPGVGSKGICQFQEGTFAYYSKEAGIENPDIWNVDHQLQTMAYMFSIGQERHWSCWKKYYASLGG